MVQDKVDLLAWCRLQLLQLLFPTAQHNLTTNRNIKRSHQPQACHIMLDAHRSNVPPTYLVKKHLLALQVT
jgi:hypothetical protein